MSAARQKLFGQISVLFIELAIATPDGEATEKEISDAGDFLTKNFHQFMNEYDRARSKEIRQFFTQIEETK